MYRVLSAVPCTLSLSLSVYRVYRVQCTYGTEQAYAIVSRSPPFIPPPGPCLNGVNRNGNNTPCLGKYRPYRSLSGDRYYVLRRNEKGNAETRDLHAFEVERKRKNEERRMERKGEKGGRRKRKKGTNRVENDREQQKYVFLSCVSGFLRFRYIYIYIYIYIYVYIYLVPFPCNLSSRSEYSLLPLHPPSLVVD